MIAEMQAAMLIAAHRELFETLRSGSMTRRGFLKAATALGVGIAAAEMAADSLDRLEAKIRQVQLGAVGIGRSMSISVTNCSSETQRFAANVHGFHGGGPCCDPARPPDWEDWEEDAYWSEDICEHLYGFLDQAIPPGVGSEITVYGQHEAFTPIRIVMPDYAEQSFTFDSFAIDGFQVMRRV